MNFNKRNIISDFRRVFMYSIKVCRMDRRDLITIICQKYHQSPSIILVLTTKESLTGSPITNLFLATSFRISLFFLRAC